MWHGRTSLAKADAYAAFLRERAIPDYRSVPGNISATILRQDKRDSAHFITMSYWKDMDSIRAFAGDNVDTAKYYTEDKDFLLEFEPAVQHYFVEGHANGT